MAAKAEIPERYLDAWRVFLNTHSAAVERTEKALAGAGLPPLSWYDALWPLYRAPGRKLRMGELAAQVVTIGRSGLTRLVDRLEAQGLVTREPSPGDRRGTVVAITREGSALVRRMWPVYATEIQRSFVDVLDEQEAVALGAALARVHDALVERYASVRSRDQIPKSQRMSSLNQYDRRTPSRT